MLKLVILEYGIYSRTSFVAGLVNRSSKRLKGLDETLISEETGDKYPVSFCPLACPHHSMIKPQKSKSDQDHSHI